MDNLAYFTPADKAAFLAAWITGTLLVTAFVIALAEAIDDQIISKWSDG